MRDDQIVEAFQRGNKKVFDDLLSRYELKVFRMIQAMINHSEDAKELAQEVFMKVYSKLETFRGESSLSTWIFRITSNHCKNYLIRKKLIKFVSLGDSEDGLVPEVADESEGADLTEKIEKAERQKVFYQALNQLNALERQVIILKEISQLSYDEITALTGLTLGTLKSKLSRSKEKLKKILEGKI